MEEAGLSFTKPLYYDFICEQPHASVQFFKALSESTCVLFRGALLLQSDKRWTKLPNAVVHNGDLEVHFEKGWLQYMAPVVVVDIDCPRTTIYRSLSPQTAPSLIPFFHHYFTKVFPPIAKRCTVVFSWWNIIWSTNWRVFTLPEILRFTKFFLLQNLDHQAFFFGLSWTALICYCLSLSAQNRGVWMHKILFRPALVSLLSSRSWRTCGPVSL